MIARLAAWTLVAALMGGGAAQAEPPPLSQGETLYVPVYSHILHGNLDSRGNATRVLLSSMLSIRNTDPKRAIHIRSVKYYDTDGGLLRDFKEPVRRLGPLGSADLLIEHKNAAGGSGANFLVTWESETPVNPPILETINVYLFGAQSVAFASPGRAIRTD